MTAHKITEANTGFFLWRLKHFPKTRTINRPQPQPIQPLLSPEWALARELEVVEAYAREIRPSA